uniref:Uncharacterized protein n=1 Tax=Strigamia maritima TaxID=126957 RepID=T1J5X7_STRMM
MLSSSAVYVGGSDNTEGLQGSRIRSNFVGCLRKVEFTADTLNLNLIELGRLGNKLINVHGNIQFMCQEVEAADPITFTNKESFLILPSWEGTRTGSISFKIRTNEPNGLLMYNSGATTAGGDFFAFEMMDGHIYLLLNLGSGAVKVKASNRRVDDGHWHAITLRRSGESNQLDLEGALFVGGVGTSLDAIVVPVELWTGTLRYGYVGCMRDLVVNGNAIDIATYAKKQDSGSIRPACHTLPPQCDSQPCMNGGVCSEGWNRFICDCSATGFVGPTCGKDATTLNFNGDQYLRVSLPDESHTQAEDLVLRFRTTRPSGLLLASTTEKTTDRLEVAMELGRIKLAIHLGDKEKIMHAGSGLNDNQWHTLRMSRRGRSVELKVDDEPAVLDEVSGKHTTLEFRTMHIGAVIGLGPPAPQQSTTGAGGVRETPNFVGHMQQLVFNGDRFFDTARTGQVANMEVTAKFGKKELVVHHPVTFKSKHTFVGLSQLKAYSTMNLYFQFKTLEPNGLILYNVGKGQDFVAIELVNGHLHYLFNLGDRAWRVRSNTRNTLNDNRWHAVTIGRPTPRQHTLMVDDMIATVSSAGNNIHLDLDGILYVGGVPKSMYSTLPKMVQSKHGFEGCLASLDLNGDTPDPTRDALIPSTSVVAGCDGPSTKCSPHACANRGVCIQQWNSYTCDCDMTSFTGPTCSDGKFFNIPFLIKLDLLIFSNYLFAESSAYEFEPTHGVITFTFPLDKRPDTKADLLALGFITNRDKATLVRIDSSNTNDFMELGIVDGNIIMVYNMGTEDHPIGEMATKVNDGQYHVIRFTRSGANSTFQLDDYNVQIIQPKGKQLIVFNSQSRIQIGGRLNSIKRTIEQPFEGIISGLVFNGLRVLDLASERDPRINIQGDVTLLLSLPLAVSGSIRPTRPSGRIQGETQISRMQQTTATGGSDTDDIVFSGSGCGADDDEDCATTLDTGSGDDLITPVFIPTTTPKPRKTTTTPSPRKRPTEGSGKHCEDDDEDCEQGSGSGELSGVRPKVTPDDIFFPSTAVVTTTTTRASINAHTPTLQRPTLAPITHLSEPTTRASRGKTGDFFSPFPTTSLPPILLATTDRPIVFVNYDDSHGRRPKTEYGGSPGSNAESTALVIGIIAGILIAIVLIILLVYKCRSRSEGSYKIDESKNYQFAASGGVGVPGNSLMLNGQRPPQMNGNLKMGEKANKLPKKKDLKDIKEWYV